MKRLKSAHKDIKPQNLLIFDGGKVMKVADVGISKTYNHTITQFTVSGTLSYMSPEFRKAFDNEEKKV